MKNLWLDTETFGHRDIRVGTHAYTEACEVMLVAWAVDEEPVSVWDRTTSDPMPDRLAAALADPEVRVWAHNYQFDRFAMKHGAGVDIPIERWRCTMALALSHSLPGALGKLGTLFGLSGEDAKMDDGRRLVLKFCKFQGKKQKIRRRTRDTDPEDWQRFMEYAARDVEAMRKLTKRMPRCNWTAQEVELFHLDGRINERGVAVDAEFAIAAAKACDLEQRRLAKDAADMSNGELEATTQRDALLQYLHDRFGIVLADLRGSTVENLLDSADLDWGAAELLRNRLQASTVSVRKYTSIARAMSADHRLRGGTQFRGAARTGRLAGRVFQPHNLPRPPRHIKQPAILEAIDAFKAGCIDLLVPNVMEMASAALRGLLVAPEGRKLVVCDLSNIEGRVVAWLAGEEWKLDAFRERDAKTGPDLYKLAYAKAFGRDVTSITDDERQIGKVMELALGFQGASGAFTTMAAGYGVRLPEPQVLEIVRGWRDAHPNIRDLWYDMDAALKAATDNPKAVIPVGPRLVVDSMKLGSNYWLRIRLPSGRYLCYPNPQVDPISGKWSYMGVNQFTRKWERIKSYGGKAIENATQACAADILMHGMLLAEKNGYPPVMSVHDEIISETPNTEEFTVHELAALMTRNPAWADGLPLAAEGYEATRYRK